MRRLIQTLPVATTRRMLQWDFSKNFDVCNQKHFTTLFTRLVEPAPIGSKLEFVFDWNISTNLFEGKNRQKIQLTLERMFYDIFPIYVSMS